MDHQGRTILSKNLKELRDAFDMSQEDVAGAAQIDRSYVSFMESRRNAATIDMLDKIAPVFHVSIAELLTPGIVTTATARRGK